jgi:hypothetical protein
MQSDEANIHTTNLDLLADLVSSVLSGFICIICIYCPEQIL